MHGRKQFLYKFHFFNQVNRNMKLQKNPQSLSQVRPTPSSASDLFTWTIKETKNEKKEKPKRSITRQTTPADMKSARIFHSCFSAGTSDHMERNEMARKDRDAESFYRGLYSSIKRG